VILRCGGVPVFVDVDPVTLNIDPNQVESAITPRTTAILAVHLFGVTCDTQALGDIAARHGLSLVYDGAHAFARTVGARPVTDFGDATALSFHATKLFQTAEGGALVCRSDALRNRAELLRNHGICADTDVAAIGENAKMSELSAALGLAVWGSLPAERANRLQVARAYAERLVGLPGITLPPWDAPGLQPHYFPLRIAAGSGVDRDRVWAALAELNIHTRRYFPLLCDTTAYRQEGTRTFGGLPVARRASTEVLCLPFFGDLSEDDVDRICAALRWAACS
jgi:dTDP-4-amino-4,6-dideoxygalactose transaminase